MSSPVVVQGTNVQPAFGDNPEGNTEVSHEPSQGGCKDPIFAVLFYVNVAAIAAVAIIYGPDAFSTDAEFSYEGFIYAALVSAVLSLLFSGLGLSVLMCIPETMIKVALIFVVIAAGIGAIAGFVSGSIFAGIIGLVFFGIALCYARAVWSRCVCGYVLLARNCGLVATCDDSHWSLAIESHLRQ